MKHLPFCMVVAVLILAGIAIAGPRPHLHSNTTLQAWSVTNASEDCWIQGIKVSCNGSGYNRATNLFIKLYDMEHTYIIASTLNAASTIGTNCLIYYDGDAVLRWPRGGRIDFQVPSNGTDTNYWVVQTVSK